MEILLTTGESMIRKLFKWIFKAELQELNSQIQRTKEATADYERYQRTLDNT